MLLGSYFFMFTLHSLKVKRVLLDVHSSFIKGNECSVPLHVHSSLKAPMKSVSLEAKTVAWKRRLIFDFDEGRSCI